MADGLGYGRKRLVEKIVVDNWGVSPHSRQFSFDEILYIIQEMIVDEGKKYHEDEIKSQEKYMVFKSFVRHLLYRNLANYDSMILLTSDKGCITGDALLEMPRDLIKYPKGIPLKELVGKGQIFVKSYSIPSGKFSVQKAKGVEYVKKDHVYEIVLNDGKHIKATADHPFLTSEGTYKQLQDLTNNDILRLVDGGAHMISRRYVGVEEVYDVVDVENNHNFIVNGFVVSNTGKSSSAIMMASYWCKLLGIKFDPKRHIAYNNADVMNKIESLNKFEPIIADEAVRFASAAEWARTENKELKKRLAQVRTKHLLYILCFPLKISRLESNYLQSFVNYWVDLYDRGLGAIYVKDKNPVHDAWRLKDFMKLSSYTEFSNPTTIENALKKHPNFWKVIKFPKPPDKLYDRYLTVREKNVYDDENILSTVTKPDIHNALLILSLRDIMLHDTALSMNRILLHIRNNYDISLNKAVINSAISDAQQLVAKVREKAITI